MTLTEPEIEEIIKKAIVLYNRLRSPEITAKLLSVSPSAVFLSFSGGFCYDCGIMEYATGFAKHTKAFTDKIELKIEKTRQIDARTFEAEYLVKTK